MFNLQIEPNSWEIQIVGPFRKELIEKVDDDLFYEEMNYSQKRLRIVLNKQTRMAKLVIKQRQLEYQHTQQSYHILNSNMHSARNLLRECLLISNLLHHVNMKIPFVIAVLRLVIFYGLRVYLD
jgi:hypothetical protein